jgi:hypothetical protein
LRDALEERALAPDETHFDVDLFVSATFTVDRAEAVGLLRRRAESMTRQRRDAEALVARMGARVPVAAGLIMATASST